ncbi:competence protein ComE [Pontibacillus halophilus JSM 076056 = DSM 19796]|uniref:Competence protein ComE n=1 Tax=Pontibacillus halophilus JSM 076056 = DSM 19796 TaxID=1385510 RepID=A0A0A5GQZ2_9BACI|nr:helix-hairpin-helix domain-containing protein [Pontibacillus halophilus]KGX93560.1 competence protein ComE [Pontibacillus halophilus JSM 076056 = DSM 19796]
MNRLPKIFATIVAGVIILLLVVQKEPSNENGAVIQTGDVVENPVDEETVVEPHTFYVDVKGEVVKPGVYEASLGDRVQDVINRAGGIKETGNPYSVNLAQKVVDEMVILVTNQEESTGQREAGSPSSQDGKVRINQATQEELETLPGIGPSKASAILQHREEHGPFKKVEDLLEVSGIGESTLQNIQESVQLP